MTASVYTSLPGIGGLVVENGLHQSSFPDGGAFVDGVQLIVLTVYSPNADISTGNWTEQTAGGALYAGIDETNPVDSDYIVSGNNPTADQCEVRIAAQTPVADTNHTVSYRIRSDGAVNLTVKLMCGSTLIKQWVHSGVSSTFTTYNQVLTTGEADTISDYTDLRLRFIAN
jgi:hypothetical protein